MTAIRRSARLAINFSQLRRVIHDREAIGQHDPVELHGSVNLFHRSPILGTDADADHQSGGFQLVQRLICAHDVVKPAVAFGRRRCGREILIWVVQRGQLRARYVRPASGNLLPNIPGFRRS